MTSSFQEAAVGLWDRDQRGEVDEREVANVMEACWREDKEQTLRLVFYVGSGRKER
jgi:hypothetical protein